MMKELNLTIGKKFDHSIQKKLEFENKYKSYESLLIAPSGDQNAFPVKEAIFFSRKLFGGLEATNCRSKFSMRKSRLRRSGKTDSNNSLKNGKLGFLPVSAYRVARRERHILKNQSVFTINQVSIGTMRAYVPALVVNFVFENPDELDVNSIPLDAVH